MSTVTKNTIWKEALLVKTWTEEEDQQLPQHHHNSKTLRKAKTLMLDFLNDLVRASTQTGTNGASEKMDQAVVVWTYEQQRQQQRQAI